MYADEDRQSALTRALIMAGAAMTQPGQGGIMGALGRGGMMGMQAYDQTFDDIAKRRLQEEQQRQLAMKAKLEEIGLARQETLARIFGQFSGDVPAQGAAAAAPSTRPSIVDAPGWATSAANPASANAAPSIRPQPQDTGTRQEALIRALSLGGFGPEAKAQLEIFKGLEGEVYGDPQVDKNGRTFVNTKRGPRYIEGGGFVPRDELVETDLGGKKVFRTKYDMTPRGEMGKTMTPGEVASNAVAWANYFKPGDMKETPDGYVAFSPDGKGGVRAVPTGVKPKPERLTQGEAEKLLTLDEIIAQAGNASDLIKKNPGAIGPENRLIPNAALNAFGTIANIDTRAQLADLSSKLILARSGAAVTGQEFKRLEPFLASDNDTPKAAQAKLAGLMREMQTVADSRRSFYTSQGYSVPPSQFAKQKPADMSIPDLAKAIEAELARRAAKGR